MADFFGTLADDDDLLENDVFSAQENVAGDRFGDKQNLALVGLDRQQAMILKMINENKVPSGLLLAGPRGVGKTSLAVMVAQTLLAGVEDPVDEGPGLFGGEPPNETKIQKLGLQSTHPVSLRMTSGAHPDFMMLDDQPDPSVEGKGRPSILVDDIRKINKFLRMTASGANGWRVVIIGGAERMNVAAQNALLKILEEPPPRAVLILTTHQPGALLPTIRSRVHLIDFAFLGDNDFNQVVRAMGFSPSATERAWISALSQNAPGQARDLLEQDRLEIIRDFASLWHEWPHFQEQRWLEMVEGLAGQGSDPGTYSFFLDLWLWFIRGIIKAQANTSYRATFLGLLPGPGPEKMIKGWALGDLLTLEEETRSLFERTIHLNLEKRQAIFSARLMLTALYQQP